MEPEILAEFRNLALLFSPFSACKRARALVCVHSRLLGLLLRLSSYNSLEALRHARNIYIYFSLLSRVAGKEREKRSRSRAEMICEGRLSSARVFTGSRLTRSLYISYFFGAFSLGALYGQVGFCASACVSFSSSRLAHGASAHLKNYGEGLLLSISAPCILESRMQHIYLYLIKMKIAILKLHIFKSKSLVEMGKLMEACAIDSRACMHGKCV